MPTMRLPARTTNRCRLAERRSAAERAQHRVGLKVVWLLRPTIWMLPQGYDLHHAPPRPFGLRPSASRSDTNRAFARHEHLRFSFKLFSYFLKTGTVLNDAIEN